MRAKTLQIVWHSKEPVLTAAFHPNGYLATGGADKDIKLWSVSQEADAAPTVSYLTSLSGHAKAVNCLRFSPSGACLVSAGDSGEVLMWKPSSESSGGTLQGANNSPDKQQQRPGSPTQPDTPIPYWKVCQSLRGHHEDVLDIAWSPDGTALATVGVDNECLLYDAEANRAVSRLAGHRHFVQGVTWDPLGAYLVTQSADRTCRIHGRKPAPAGKKGAAAAAAAAASAAAASTIKDIIFLQSLAKRQLPSTSQPAPTAAAASGDPNNNTATAAAAAAAAAAGASGRSSAEPSTAAGGSLSSPTSGTPAAAARPRPQAQQHCLFQDEGLATFFRRLAWSPDGTLLVTPAGCFKRDADAPAAHAAYVFARGSWNAPLLQLPTPSSPPLVVRFCPVFYQGEEQQGTTQQQQMQGATAAAAAGGGADATSSSTSSSLSSVLRLPYKMVFAVATSDSVLLYCTQHLAPFALLGSLHYANITDLAWAPDGSSLLITSSDGFCSLATFAPGELGQPLALEQLPAGLQAALARAATAAAAVAVAPGAASKHSKKAAKAAAVAAAAGAVVVPAAGAGMQVSPARTSAAAAGAAAGATPAAAAAVAPVEPGSAGHIKVSRPAESPAAGVPPPRKRICPMPVGADPPAPAAAAGVAVAVGTAPSSSPLAGPAVQAAAAPAAPAGAAVALGGGAGGSAVKAAPVKRITPQPVPVAAVVTPGSAPRPVRHIQPIPVDPPAPAAAAAAVGVPAQAAGVAAAPAGAAPTPAADGGGGNAEALAAGSACVASSKPASGGGIGMSMARLALQAGLAAAKRAAGGGSAATPPPAK